jgi:putative ABC transport system permease protein
VYDSPFTVAGRPPANPADVPITAHRLVTSGYLQALGVRLVRGRLLDDHDRDGAAPVVVVTEEFVRQAWPNADPIGQRVHRGLLDDRSYPWMTVVGVVADVKEDVFNFRINRPAWYIPYAQSLAPTVTHSLVVRTIGDPGSLASSVVAAVHAVEPQQSVSDVRPMSAHVADVLVTERFSAALMSAFAAVGVFLAACGLAGATAYSAGQRTAEIGLRMALGATRRNVLALILREGITLIGIGVVVGAVAARGLSAALAGTLYGLSANDLESFVGAAAVLTAASLAGCLVPALRAMNVDPLVAFKSD